MTRRADWSRLELQLPTELLAQIQDAADAQALTVSAWARLTLARAAAAETRKPASPRGAGGSWARRR